MDSDSLIKIIEHYDDINSWLDFMLVSKYIYYAIYPEFIQRKFKIMKLFYRKMSPCSRGNHKIKAVGDHIIVTDINLISKHCQFEKPYIYETYGLFVSKIDYDTIKIDYDKIIDFLSCNEYLINHAKQIFTKKSHIRQLSIEESYSMTLNIIERNGGENYAENIKELNRKYIKYFKMSVKDGDNYCICGMCLSPNLCTFCGANDDDKDYHINETTIKFSFDPNYYNW